MIGRYQWTTPCRLKVRKHLVVGVLFRPSISLVRPQGAAHVHVFQQLHPCVFFGDGQFQKATIAQANGFQRALTVGH